MELLVTWVAGGTILGIFGIFITLVGVDKNVLRSGDINSLVIEVSKSMTPRQIVMTTIVDVALVLMAFVSLALLDRKQPKIGPSPKRRVVLPAFFGLAAALIVAHILPWSTGKSLMSMLMNTEGMRSVILLLAILLPPFEELYYRGIILPRLVVISGRVTGVILGTLWFTGMHYFQLRGDELMLLPIFGVGAICAIQRVAWNSLVPPMITHFVYNLVVIWL